MKNINELIRKYWKGTSELDEEQELKKHFHENEKIEIEDEYFNYLEHKRTEKIDAPDFDKNILDIINAKAEKKRTLLQKINWQIAAAIVLLFTVGAIFTSKQVNNRNTITTSAQTEIIDTYDDPQLAYEETKKALLLISSKLNKGQEYTSELEKFSQAQESLKN